MRKLSLFGGLLLTLAAATSAFAASPAPQVASTPGHTWTTAFKDGAISAASTLKATSRYSSAKVAIRLTGATKGEKITITLFDQTGATSHVLASRTIRITNVKGTYSATWRLSKASRAALKALTSTAQLDLSVKDATMAATGQFTGK